MSLYSKKDVQDPLLFDGGDEDNTPLVEAPKQDAANDGLLSRQ